MTLSKISRIWLHALVLALILCASLVYVRTNHIMFADEGSVIIQTEHLREGRGWLIDHPAPEFDPEFRAYPIHLSGSGTKGAAPYLRHWLYPMLLYVADFVGGLTAMFVLSAFGTWLASVLVALVARRLRSGTEVYALYLTGLGSPLFFDSLLVHAHTLGAAAVAGLLLVIGSGRIGRGRMVGAAAVVVPLVMLRTEGRFITVGLAAALLVLWRRRRIRAYAELAGVLVVSTAVAYVVEKMYEHAVIGVSLGPTGDILAQSTFIVARFNSFVSTWLQIPLGRPAGQLLLVLASLLVVVTALVIRFRRALPANVMMLTAGGFAISGALITEGTVIPGLLVAFPFLFALVLLTRGNLEDDRVFLYLFAAVLFALGVLATQYEQGGTFEWGGRYFAIGLPLVVPLIVVAAKDRLAGMSSTVNRQVLAGAMLVFIGFDLAGLMFMRRAHEDDGRFVRQLIAAQESTGVERPLVITTYGGAAKLAYPAYKRARWLTPFSGEVDKYIKRAAATGEPFLYIKDGVKQSELPSGVCIRETTHVVFEISVLQRCG